MVERRQSTRKRIMREFQIGELSGVDRPAQAHAKMTLMKRADPEDGGVGKDYGDYPVASVISQEVQAVDFDTVLAEDEAREAAAEVGDDLREKWCALQRAFATIAADETVSASDKITSMQESLQQYIDSLAEQSQTIADEMTKSLSAVPAIAELLKRGTSEGDESMDPNAETKKQLAELQKSVATLQAQLEAATAKEPAKKAADIQKSLDEATAKIAELTTKLETETAAKAEAVAKAGMSDAEKEHMSGLTGKAKMDFMQAAPADRKKQMGKAADDNPVVYKSESSGEEFRKSDDPRLVKMAKAADEDRALAKAEREKRETAEFEKRAGEAPYAHYAGEGPEKVAVVRAVSKIEDKTARETLEKMLEVGAKAIKAAFEKIGHQREDVAKTATDFNKRVDEIMTRDKISKSAAMKKARTEFPAEYTALQASGAQTN